MLTLSPFGMYHTLLEMPGIQPVEWMLTYALLVPVWHRPLRGSAVEAGSLSMLIRVVGANESVSLLELMPCLVDR